MCAGGFHWSHSCVSVRTLGTKPKLCSGEIYIPTKCPPVEFYRDDSSKFTNARARAMGEHLKKQPGKQEEQEESPTPTNQMNPTVSMLQSSRCFDLEYPKHIMVKQLFLCDSEWFVWHLQSVVLSHTYWYILYGTLRRNLPCIYTNLFDSNQQYVGRRNKFSSKQQNGKFQDFFWKHLLQR